MTQFDATSTTDQVVEGISLSGKTAVVTGGYSGIGLETVRELASRGAEIVIPARNEDKAKDAVADIQNTSVAKMDHGGFGFRV